jgi:hypothetical protein
MTKRNLILAAVLALAAISAGYAMRRPASAEEPMQAVQTEIPRIVIVAKRDAADSHR